MKKTILVVDDDAEITDLIEVYLCNEGFGVIKCYDGLQAQNVLESNEISLAIVDVMMPQMNGFDLCRKIREQFSFPIIILTARFEFTDKINGLSIGADDYMVKPFHPLELIARVKAQLRRAEIYNVTNKENQEENNQILEEKKKELEKLQKEYEELEKKLNQKGDDNSGDS